MVSDFCVPESNHQFKNIQKSTGVFGHPWYSQVQQQVSGEHLLSQRGANVFLWVPADPWCSWAVCVSVCVNFCRSNRVCSCDHPTEPWVDSKAQIHNTVYKRHNAMHISLKSLSQYDVLALQSVLFVCISHFLFSTRQIVPSYRCSNAAVTRYCLAAHFSTFQHFLNFKKYLYQSVVYFSWV